MVYVGNLYLIYVLKHHPLRLSIADDVLAARGDMVFTCRLVHVNRARFRMIPLLGLFNLERKIRLDGFIRFIGLAYLVEQRFRSPVGLRVTR